MSRRDFQRKLTKYQRLHIAYRYLVEGDRQQDIADDYEIHQSRVSDIVSEAREALNWDEE